MKSISDVKSFIEWRLGHIRKQSEGTESKTLQEQLEKRWAKLTHVDDFMNKLRAEKNLNLENTEQLKIYLQKLAREISSAIKTNPKFVRAMAREIILKKIHVAEEVYEKWKPPYSAWDKNGTSMYFWQEGDQPWEFTPDEKHIVKM